MSQHLNLLSQALRRRQRPPWSLAHATAGIGLLLLACLVGNLVFAHYRQRVQTELTELQQASSQARLRLAGLQRPAATSALLRLDDELARLQQQGADADLVRSLVASGRAGQPQGHAELLLALARQADPAVWITGLQLSVDGSALELRGRMRDPAALPAYLTRLHQEPLFQGRRFDQLGLRRIDAPTDAAAGSTTPLEFTLRSQRGAAATGPTGSRP
ncbi:MAG: hypothetical protein RIQ60_3083 [Pseudomonadota bacterium]|jgi:Tfp pilus assembly protein PilN